MRNFLYFCIFYVLRCYFVSDVKEIFSCFFPIVFAPWTLILHPTSQIMTPALIYIHVGAHKRVLARNRLHTRMCARVSSGCFLRGRAWSLRKRNPFLLQNNALNCDVTGRSKHNTVKMWCKTSEIRATILANLVPTRPTFPVAASRSSDREAADRQAWSLLATKASIVNSHALHAATRDSIMYVSTFFCASVCAQEIASRWTLDRQDKPHTLIILSRHLPASYATISRERSFILP